MILCKEFCLIYLLRPINRDQRKGNIVISGGRRCVCSIVYPNKCIDFIDFVIIAHKIVIRVRG